MNSAEIVAFYPSRPPHSPSEEIILISFSFIANSSLQKTNFNLKQFRKLKAGT